jgi:methyltransferase
MTALAVLMAIGVFMAAEARVSARNEGALRARGAREPRDDVYRWMQFAYPGAFVVMGVEGFFRGGSSSGAQSLAGGTLLFAAKALKYWAIASLGPSWSFRVLVVPGAPLVTHGPYRFLRHPNYVAVIGELIGAATLLNARLAGPLVALVFAELIRRRVTVEERALSQS